jgi:anthranilate synthase component 1
MNINLTFNDFSHNYLANQAQLVWTKRVADLDTPVSAMLKLSKDKAFSFLLESVEGGDQRGRYSIIGLKPDLIWKYSDHQVVINRTVQSDKNNFELCQISVKQGVLESLRSVIAESQIDTPDSLPPMAAGLVGYMSYDMVRLIEQLPDQNPDPLAIPDGIFIRPTIMAIFDNVEGNVIIATPVRPDPLIAPDKAYTFALERLTKIIDDFGQALPSETLCDNQTEIKTQVKNLMSLDYFYTMVKKAKDYILSGDIFQVVLSQRLSLPFTLPAFSLYRALRRTNPSPFLFFLDFEDFSLVGSSPEILVRKRADIVTIRPIAGTRKRGKTRQEDIDNATDLLKDTKELAEHLMLLDLGRNDVGRVALPGTVKVTERNIIERYSHVMHIVSNVEGIINPIYDSLDTLFAGFPAGTVSGAPKVRAMEIIDELEPLKRSFYAGCIGYFAANGTMDTCITLRTALVKDGMMIVQAGAGIVADSNPDSEYQECLNKAQALILAAHEAYRFADFNNNS